MNIGTSKGQLPFFKMAYLTEINILYLHALMQEKKSTPLTWIKFLLHPWSLYCHTTLIIFIFRFLQAWQHNKGKIVVTTCVICYPTSLPPWNFTTPNTSHLLPVKVRSINWHTIIFPRAPLEERFTCIVQNFSHFPHLVLPFAISMTLPDHTTLETEDYYYAKYDSDEVVVDIKINL